MNGQTLFVLTLLSSMILLIHQRSDPARKKAMRWFTVPSYLLILVFVWWNAYWLEAVLGFILSLLISGLFWLFIGRYNPVSSSDDIHVLGMDD